MSWVQEPNGHELTNLDRILQRLNYLKFVGEAVREADKAARSEAVKHLKKGDTLAVRSPIDDTKMSRVSMSDPKHVAHVADPAALDAWIRENYPDKIQETTTIVGSDTEVTQVLREHAPHLLAHATVVPGWVVNELLTISQGAGTPVGFGGECDTQAPPGIKVTVPDGTLSITVDRTTGPAAFRALWDAHMFGLDGTLQLPPPHERSNTDG
ncbi:MAG: hypothetical protein ACREQ5_00715 [Candidatus Dormibacteria bacterium]